MNGPTRKDTLTEDHSWTRHGVTPIEAIGLAFLACWLIASGAMKWAWRKMIGHS
jgi:hypothetical protein